MASDRLSPVLAAQVQVPESCTPQPDTIDLIRDTAKRDRLWGAERIHGELLNLGIEVGKRTLQKYQRGVRRNHGG